MNYESLLLSLGGGVIPSGHRSTQNSGAATLVIGIGGTGVASLAELKRKVYQDPIPDDPDDPVPRYSHIQLLAIDSDEDVIAKMKGRACINGTSEFFPLTSPSWWNIFRYSPVPANHVFPDRPSGDFHGQFFTIYEREGCIS